VDNTKEFRCLSLCTGYAGIELGLKKVIPNLKTVCYVEIEAFACSNLVAKIEAGKLDAAPIWTDIKTFNGRPFRNRIHIITGGYPCQPFSVAGKRKGTADPRHLWPYIEKIIKETRPIWCFFENVSGHLAIGFPSVYKSLRLMGYKVEAGLFTAAECGAPHKRERLFILAYSSRKRQLVCRMQSANDNKFSRTGNTCSQNATMCDSNKWPSRPGQPQHEWEEPRVVGKCASKRLEGKAGAKLQGISNGLARTSEGQAQSRLGRAANGPSGRVDRLRLLGNGVVPQCAELAFRTLIKLF